MAHRLVVGLGNPGSGYTSTRHNIGFDVLNHLASQKGLRFIQDKLGPVEIARWEESRLLKPLTYMNLSGQAVQAWLQWLKWTVDEVLVVVDDTTLPLGQIRIRSEGSSGGHNGLRSLETSLGTQKYARIRCGVGPLPAGIPLENYVLGKFKPEEHALRQSLIQSAGEAVQSCQTHGIPVAMNLHNGRSGDSSTEKAL